MKYYLKDILNRLQKYSASLDQSSFLIDKPWVVSSDDSAYQKLIFRKDGRVHLSKDGNLTDGKWEYLPEAQALIIDYGDNKKLYRHQFLDEAVLALKIDGRKDDDSDFFLLANETLVPDANAKEYLHNKYLSGQSDKSHNLDEGTKVERRFLQDGTKIEIRIPAGSYREIPYYNNEILKDGEYILQGGGKKLIVESGYIVEELTKNDYPDNITIWQSISEPRIGDQIYGTTDNTIIIKDKYDDRVRLQIKDNYITDLTNLTLNYKITAAIFLVFIVFVVVILVSGSN